VREIDYFRSPQAFQEILDCRWYTSLHKGPAQGSPSLAVVIAARTQENESWGCPQVFGPQVFGAQVFGAQVFGAQVFGDSLFARYTAQQIVAVDFVPRLVCD
jgi:hypothetical protein